MRLKGFCGGSYQSQSPLAANERTINLYSERIEGENGTTDVALYPTPGVQMVTDGVQSPGFAHIEALGREFTVNGASFLEIDANGVRTSRGTVTLGDTPATISSNGKTGGQLLITAGTNAYLFTLSTNAFAQVTALDGLATMGDQIDGYFLVLDALNSKWYFSGLNDGATWSTSVNFAARNRAPDSWVSMKVANGYIWLLGTATSEIWYNAGTFPMPFQPYPTAVVPHGCGAPFSPAMVGGVLHWLGSDKEVLQASGFSPTVVSTYALSNVLSGYSSVSDGVGDTYTSRGHSFYILSFDAAAATHCYDLNMQLWHERLTWISEESAFVAWRPRFHAFVFGQHRMLDASGGRIYEMSETFSEDVDERPIRRLRRSPTLYRENQRIFVDAFELDVEPGLGNTVDPGSNPQVMLRISNDGGKTWGTEHMRSAGKIGEYGHRVRWNRMGSGRRRVLEVSTTDAIQWRFMGAFAEIRQAPAGVQKYQQAQQ